ncbi:glycosyltransferase family 9 protein [Pelotomaculum isophthalicicum JI]|uniref:Glycosyltransferase family 9 protein n=1 Tax=Pelotomaculum isophthalicicum JI TaxID=947010 RepID=A0A9X4H0J5_9FIRM|nr:glycosyltransferase family 9 protein [Pelotomaculum isophthalicicum]MDF9406796.1 glycosyltransferase family 9 protein [Pelotomaculum isophthalicicum JI]
MRERGNKILKFFDKFIGIPLIFILGLTKKKKKFNFEVIKNKNKLKFILLKTAGIGDTILLSAVVCELKDSFPCSKITLVCSSNNCQCARYLPGIDEVVLFNMSRPLESLRSIAALDEFDILFDFAPWARINSLISYFARAELKVGFRRKNMFRHYVYDISVNHMDDTHEIENYRKLLRAVDIDIKNFKPAFLIKNSLLQNTAWVLEDGRRSVVMHPFPGGSKSYLKEWPLENWVEIGMQLIKEGCKIFISGGKEDIGRAEYIAREIEKGGGECSVLAGKLSLNEVAGILKKSSLLITVNTGIMHMGAVVGIDLVALHGPTSPLRWGPVSDKAVVIKPKIECSPCISLGFEYGCEDGGCMETITVEEVLLAAKGILSRNG